MIFLFYFDSSLEVNTTPTLALTTEVVPTNNSFQEDTTMEVPTLATQAPTTHLPSFTTTR